MSLLSQSIYTINGTKQFIGKTKKVEIPNGCEMVLFDVESLYRSTALVKKVKIALQRIYIQKEINQQTPRKLMKELLLLCKKEVHVIYERGIYKQTNSVAMELLLGAKLAIIIMVELEKAVVQTTEVLLRWK